MATVATICAGIRTSLLTVPALEYVSVTDFRPTVQTSRAAAMIVPFSQEDVVDRDSFDGTEVVAIHRLAVELWTRHLPGDHATTMALAHELPLDAIKAIYKYDVTNGYTLAPGRTIDAVTDSVFTEIGTGLVFIVCKLGVWCENRVTV